MIRRGIRFLSDIGQGSVYDTALYGPWTLSELHFSDPEKQTNYTIIPGRDGAVDLLAGISDGEPRYKPRTLTAGLECSERDRAYRTELIDEIRNRLDGYTWQMILPDDPMHYIRGVVSVAVEYNDLNHCKITLTAQCDPWRVAIAPRKVEIAASGTAQTIRIQNNGRRRCIPILGAYATGGASPSVTVTCGSYTKTLTDYTPVQASELAMSRKDYHDLSVSGSGYLTVMWQEAIL